MPTKCEGVLIPPNFDSPTCFLEEFRFPSDYTMSEDRIIPGALGGAYEPANLHLVHLGCQRRQGPRVRNWVDPKASVRGGKRTVKLGVGAFAPGAAARAAKIRNHNRWHVNRGITSPGCEFC